MRTLEDHDMSLKRKRMVEKKIVIFVNTMWCTPTKCAGIYQVNIKIGTTTEEEEEEDSFSSVAVVFNSEEGTTKPLLEPIHLYCDQRVMKSSGHRFGVWSVGSCLFNDYKLYMFPDDRGDEPEDISLYFSLHSSEEHDKRHTLKPCIFNFKTGKEEDLPALPQTRKVGPIVAVLRNHLFALSASIVSIYETPTPSFESLPLLLLDDKQQQQKPPPPPPPAEWKELTPPPFHFHRGVNSVSGHAVLGEDFILVCLSHWFGPFAYFSYNVQSGLWKPTRDPPAALPDHADDFYPPILENKALVVGKDIYCFSHYDLDLVVFSYTVLLHPNNSAAKDEPDISLNGLATRVRGLEHYKTPIHLRDDYPFKRSTAIAKVDDDHGGLFCLLHTKLPPTFPFPTQPEEVCFTFVQFKSRDSCQIIKTFSCALSIESFGLPLLLLESCYVIPVDVEEKQDQHRNKRAAAYDTDGEGQSLIS